MRAISVKVSDDMLTVFDIAKEALKMSDVELMQHCFELGFEALLRGATEQMEETTNDQNNT